MKYEPGVRSIETEEDVRKLLWDFRKEMDKIVPNSPYFEDMSWEEILGILESREHPIFFEFHRDGLTHRVNLREVANLVADYRKRSGESCDACVLKKEAFTTDRPYCGLHERPVDASSFGGSPRIRQYKDMGCDQRKPEFRPLEEVLDGARQ